MLSAINNTSFLHLVGATDNAFSLGLIVESPKPDLLSI